MFHNTPSFSSSPSKHVYQCKAMTIIIKVCVDHLGPVPTILLVWFMPGPLWELKQDL